jgi:hypothetical protein
MRLSRFGQCRGIPQELFKRQNDRTLARLAGLIYPQGVSYSSKYTLIACTAMRVERLGFMKWCCGEAVFTASRPAAARDTRSILFFLDPHCVLSRSFGDNFWSDKLVSVSHYGNIQLGR